MVMIITCMLPISIVEKNGFKKYVNFLDPSFSMPSRWKIKETGLPNLKLAVEERIQADLNGIEWLNISLDGWTDGIYRCFNGFSAQGEY